MAKSRILSGIKPSGMLHIGNYLGALRNFVTLQTGHEAYFMVADLHSLTEKFDPAEKRQEILNVIIDFLALGLDPQISTIFIQSHVPEHLELAWIFNSLTPVGDLTRMTQYKDFIGRGHSANAGLLTYPVLQAADILLYKPEAVPVGEDQLQHLELTNAIAKKFNNAFGQTFTPVKPLLTKTPRVMSLLEPEKKMSKSLGKNHIIYLNDPPEEIERKLARAVTDSGKDKKMSPGTANLFNLLEIFGEPQQLEYYQEARKNGTIRYADLKTNLAKVIAHHFAEYRAKRLALENKPDYVAEVIAEGQQKARQFAQTTMAEVKQKIGLV